MDFLSPERLLLLVAVALLGGAYVAVQFRRRSYAVKFTNLELLDRVAPRRPGWRRHVPALLFLGSIAVLVVAFAQPQADQRIPRERATIIMAIDTSLSMQATDVAPSRIEAAQEAATEFVDVLPPKINLGLVLFNGNTRLAVAPTTDREAVKRAIADIELGERTAIGEAIFTGLEAIAGMPPGEDGEPVPARIVLMSDGETTDGRPNEDAAQAAVEAGVQVSTIAFGTDEGIIEIPEEPVPIPVPVDREALEAIADATDGNFYEAASVTQLREVYDDIGSSVGYTTEPREISSWFVGAALIGLLLTAVASLAWFSRLP
jgi:Ca-activated chloride channel family protein